MKTPHKCRTGTPPSAENGPTGHYFGVSCYRRPTIRASPTTFHTVSPRTLVNSVGFLRSVQGKGNRTCSGWVIGSALRRSTRRRLASEGDHDPYKSSCKRSPLHGPTTERPRATPRAGCARARTNGVRPLSPTPMPQALRKAHRSPGGVRCSEDERQGPGDVEAHAKANLRATRPIRGRA